MSAPHVTIFSDASFCQKTKRAGWAAWMKCAGRPALTVGGRLVAQTEGASHAETFAAVNALYAAWGKGYFHEGHTVMLQSDCLHALNLLRHFIPGTVDSPHADGLSTSVAFRSSRLKPSDKMAIAAVKTLVKKTKIKIVVRHVRGHQPGAGRAWVNNECDKMAKKYMRDARDAAA